MPGQNGTLRQYLDSLAKPLNTEAQNTIIRQLVFGLCYLHEHKVAHRDFKSPNVLLDSGSVSLLVVSICSHSEILFVAKFILNKN